MAQTLAAVFALNDKYTSALRTIMKSQDDFAKKQSQIDAATQTFIKRQESMRSAAAKSSAGTDDLVTKLAKLVSVALLLKKAWDGAMAAINASAMLDVQEKTYQGLLNSDRIGTQLNKYIQMYGKTSLLGQEQAGRAFTAFLPSARDLSQLEQLERLTQRLYAKDPSQGQAGAVFAMKELLAGDSLSAKERYNMIGFDNDKIRKFNTTGDIEGLIGYLDQMFNKFGATESVVEKMMDTLPTQLGKLKDSFRAAFAETATPAMETLVGTIRRLDEEMQAGKYQPFFNLMGGGLELVGKGIAFVAENAWWLVPAIGGVVSALIVYNTVTAVAAVVSAGLSNNWIGIAALAVGVTAAVGGMTLAMSDANKQAAVLSGNAKTSLAAFHDSLAADLGTTKIDAQIINSDPIKVTGQVEIEKENMKYLLDIAGAKFLAQYSAISPTSSITVQNMNVTKEVDIDTLFDYAADGIANASAAGPGGIYNDV